MRLLQNTSVLALSVALTIYSAVNVLQVQLLPSSKTQQQDKKQPTTTIIISSSNNTVSSSISNKNSQIIVPPQQDNNAQHPTYPTSIFPDKLFTVVGLESSGTKLLAQTIRTALHLTILGNMEKSEVMGEGYSNQYTTTSTTDVDDQQQYFFTEIQHLSLPWGGMGCTNHHPREHIVPVIVPGMCSKIMHEHRRQQQLLLDRRYTPTKRTSNDNSSSNSSRTMGFDDDGNSDHTLQQQQPFASAGFSDRILAQYKIPTPSRTAFLEQCQNTVGTLRYPGRHLLNLTSHMEWYQERGVDVKIVIIMRDASISRRARYGHCTNATMQQLEEQVGMTILQEVIEKYILKKNSSSSRRRRRRLVEASDDGKVLLVSYELWNQLQDNYLSLIYKKLGIDSTYKPLLEDGNQKHVKEENPTVLSHTKKKWSVLPHP